MVWGGGEGEIGGGGGNGAVSGAGSSPPPHPDTGADRSHSTWGSGQLCACRDGGRKKKRRCEGAAPRPLNPCGKSRSLPHLPGHPPAAVPLRSRRRGGQGHRLEHSPRQEPPL